MPDTTALLQHPAVRAYLLEVHRAVSGVDPAAADVIMAEVADHIRDAAADAESAARPVDVDAILSELGDPALIAAGVEPQRHEAPSAERFADSGIGVVLTVALLTVGTMLLTLLGWAAGIILLWSSTRWTRGDKIAGTIAWPLLFVLAFLLPALTGGGSLSYWHTGIVLGSLAPLGVGVWLLVRAFGRPAHRAPRDVRPVTAGRDGALGVLDRWPAAALVLGTPALGAGLVLGTALALGSWSALTPTAVGASVLAIAALGVLWSSRGWTLLGKTWSTVLLALSAATVYGVANGSITSASPARACSAGECVTLPVRIADPARLLEPLAFAVIPALVVFAVVAGVGFRSAGERPESLSSRASGILIPAALVAGSLGLGALVTVRWSGSGPLLAAVLGTAVWTTAVVLAWRSPLWGDLDRALGTVPAAAIAALLLYGVPFGSFSSGADLANPLVPSVQPEIAYAVIGGIQFVSAIWMLVRRLPATFAEGVRDAQPAPRSRP